MSDQNNAPPASAAPPRGGINISVSPDGRGLLITANGVNCAAQIAVPTEAIDQFVRTMQAAKEQIPRIVQPSAPGVGFKA